MPVLGHAFAGLTTAAYTRGSVRRRVGAALWTPALVGLAYLPDLLAQLGTLAANGGWRTATHSVLFAAAAALLLAWPLARLTGISAGRAGLLVFFSVGLHDLLDLLQGTDCRPFWPFSHRHINLPDRHLPAGMLGEVVSYGGIAGLLILARMLAVRLKRKQPASAGAPTGRFAPPRAWMMAGYGLTAAVLLLAAGTHYLRDVRRQQFETALALIRDRRPAEALPLLDEARKWPHVSNPARVHFARAEAYLRMGDRTCAEQYYLAALDEGPDDFWVLADVAIFYASSQEPLEVRRRRVEPLVATLRERFATWRDLPRVLAKIDAKLNQRASPPASVRAASTRPR